ncbi:TnsD family Tn7-like transposition protein [Pseudoteredinibacter isoporae]|uniref:TnsD family Tn7-like transposition protein n=1 Tax=Pseudoteredinibacter isoporae TaxID=570281 RepID=UPI00310B420E
MLGFPKPYSEELLYSTVARAGAHAGETSPKQLLDQVFANRKVIATVDLPNYVNSLARHYPSGLNLDTEALISRHTLLPIYAPFMPTERNKQLKRWMADRSQGAVHLASGVAASRVKAKSRLYVCRECLKEQKTKYGECYWQRLWQVPLVKICPVHGRLSVTNIELDGEHRHRFFAVEEAVIQNEVEVKASDEIFSQKVIKALQVLSNGASFDQWSAFYKQLASEFSFVTGTRIAHADIHDTVVDFWGTEWLKDAGIHPTRSDSSWLKGLFRKHRKSFSFAEHIVAITALSDGTLSLHKAAEKAANIEVHPKVLSHRNIYTLPDADHLNEDQSQWVKLLVLGSASAARKKSPALYARLYRNHRDWLLNIDSKFHSRNVSVNKRVDWQKRDRQVAKVLRHKCEVLGEDLEVPHLSRTYLIHQLDQRATIEKNLHRLPHCEHLLSLYSESTTEYQARRLTRAYLEMLTNRQEIKRWSLLRKAGLSDDRMCKIVAELLQRILSEQA